MEENVTQMRLQFGAPVRNVSQDQNAKTKQVIYRCMFLHIVFKVIERYKIRSRVSIAKCIGHFLEFLSKDL